MDIDDDGWTHITRGRIKRGDRVKVAWGAGSLRFIATGVVEEKPHHIESHDDRVRLKLSMPHRELHIVDPSGSSVTASDAGFLWDGWLFVTGAVEFRRAEPGPKRER